MSALGVSAGDYRLALQLRVKRLLHRNEEGIQINMEDTAGHETHTNYHTELIKPTSDRIVIQLFTEM